jgi:hypothetical protein
MICEKEVEGGEGALKDNAKRGTSCRGRKGTDKTGGGRDFSPSLSPSLGFKEHEMAAAAEEEGKPSNRLLERMSKVTQPIFLYLSL